MNNITFKDNLKGKNYAVSEVIGVILLIAITVTIAATVFVYVGGFFEEGLESTPSVSMTAKVSDDNSEVRITILKISESGVSWDDISGFLFDLSTGDSILNNSNWILSGDYISGGDLIKLGSSNIKGDSFIVGDEYRFSLVYKPTNSVMGSVSWIQ